MTTTARTMTRRIATDSRAIAALVIADTLEDFAACELCTLPSAELFERTDNRDGSTVQVCEHCANFADVSCSDDYDA
jgi:hypothetical protein